MALVGLVGISAFMLASFAVGGRLLALAVRTRRPPEALVGSSLLIAGGLGSVLVIAAGELPTARVPLLTISTLLVNVGITMLGVFVWCVFRPGPAGAALLVVLAALLFLSFAGDLLGGYYAGHPRSDLSRAIDYTGRIGMYAWASLEALRQWLLARRRARLGLCDPLVANRFLLWGIATGSVIGIWGFGLWSELHGVVDVRASFGWIAVFGGLCAVAVWLAFMPPPAYRRWLEAAAPSSA
jgi:hypothetical protein